MTFVPIPEDASDWTRKVIEAHNDAVRQAVDEAVERERENADPHAFARGCLVGLTLSVFLILLIGIIVTVVISA